MTDAIKQIEDALGKATSAPWMTWRGYPGSHWLIAEMGDALDGKPVYVTTDHQRASEATVSGAIEDADLIVLLRNHADVLLAAMRLAQATVRNTNAMNAEAYPNWGKEHRESIVELVDAEDAYRAAVEAKN